eukprot:scaffold116722_cov75-Phaeocystis_antarctica.AAC.4
MPVSPDSSLSSDALPPWPRHRGLLHDIGIVCARPSRPPAGLAQSLYTPDSVDVCVSPPFLSALSTLALALLLSALRSPLYPGAAAPGADIRAEQWRTAAPVYFTLIKAKIPLRTHNPIITHSYDMPPSWVWSSGYVVDVLGKAASAAGAPKASNTTRSPSGRTRSESWRHSKGDAASRSESKPLSVASRCICPSAPMKMAWRSW